MLKRGALLKATRIHTSIMLYALACVKDFGDTTVAVSRGEATIVGFLSQQTDDARAVLVENKHGHCEAEVLNREADARLDRANSCEMPRK